MPADHRRQRAFHSGDNNDDITVSQLRHYRQQSLRPGDPDVFNPFDGAPHPAQCFQCFLGHGTVGGSRRHNRNFAESRPLDTGRHTDCASDRMVFGGWKTMLDGGGLFGRGPRSKGLLPGRDKGRKDFRDRFRRLPFTEHDFRKPTAALAVQVDSSGICDDGGRCAHDVGDASDLIYDFATTLEGARCRRNVTLNAKTA